MVDSVHEGHETSTAPDSDASAKPSRRTVTACLVFFLATIVFGMYIGTVNHTHGLIGQVTSGCVVALFSMFMGMVMWEMVWRDRLKRTQENVDEASRAIHRAALEALQNQSDAYEKMIHAATKAVSMRVATRMVVEMMPGMENEEQRDAAYDRAGDIVIAEMKTVLGAVSEKTGALKAKLAACQSESSEG